MKTASIGFLKNNAGHGRYHEPSAVENVIKYETRKNRNPKNDLVAYGGIGVLEFLGIDSMCSQIWAVQQMRTRKGDLGRYIDHEIFSLTTEAGQLIQEKRLDIDAIAREMAYDFYEKDHCQVVYAVHRPHEKNTHTHIHFAVNTVNYMNGNKRRENKRQTREREARFQKIVADAIREG